MTTKPIRAISPTVIAEAIARWHKPCECCGRPWTISALAKHFGVGRLTLMRAMHENEVQAQPAPNTPHDGDE